MKTNKATAIIQAIKELDEAYKAAEAAHDALNALNSISLDNYTNREERDQLEQTESLLINLCSTLQYKAQKLHKPDLLIKAAKVKPDIQVNSLKEIKPGQLVSIHRPNFNSTNICRLICHDYTDMNRDIAYFQFATRCYTPATIETVKNGTAQGVFAVWGSMLNQSDFITIKQ